VLRKRFTGTPEFVVNFFMFLAEEVREHLAELGLRSLDEAIGRVELLDVRPALDHWKARGLDLAPLLAVPSGAASAARRRIAVQDHRLDRALDNELIARAAPALRAGRRVRIHAAIRNDHRSVGAMLGGEVVRRTGRRGLRPNTIEVFLRGTAGQSFGAFLPRGVTLRLAGDANDYVGKGLSGGRVIVAPDPAAPFVAAEQTIAGNTILYGATSGELYLAGRVGERFAVRNSGAVAVVEGVGDHGCEYMTGGTVVVLGPTGRNFAAGMSGGVAYVWRLDPIRVNRELVDLQPASTSDSTVLRGLVMRHRAETGSALAARLLDRWSSTLVELTAVVPRDFKRVREVMRAAEAAGQDVDAAVMALLAGPRVVASARPAVARA
jgi:glutamate synthase (NADPH) large chain